MKTTGVKILRYTGIALVVLSLIQIVFEVLNVMHFDILGIAENSPISRLLFTKAGGFGVELIFSMVGIVAGIVAMNLSENERFNSYLRVFGIALIVIYLIEGIMIMAQADLFSWIRLIALLVLAGLYLYGSFLLKKEDEAEAKAMHL